MPSVKDDVAISTMRDLRAEIDALSAQVDRIVRPHANRNSQDTAEPVIALRKPSHALASDSANIRVDWAVSESNRVAQC